MKLTKQQPLPILFVTALFCGLLLLTSCARKIAFVTSTVVPAAEGTVKTKKDDNNNYSLDISVKNLAPSDRLTPPRSTYLVWMDTESNGTQKIGQLRVSGSLKGSIETTTPYKPTRVFISAEDNADMPYPGTQIVLTTNGF
jgi:hypothetical protein